MRSRSLLFFFLWAGFGFGLGILSPAWANDPACLSFSPPGEGTPTANAPIEDSTAMHAKLQMKDLERHSAFTFRPIGVIRSPYSTLHRPPRQGRLAPEVEAMIEIEDEFQSGLEGIEDYDYIYILFVFDRSRGWSPKVTPPGASQARGVFATRSPNRPCPIGLTAVRLIKREGGVLHIAGIDAFDGTPVLDIKPYLGSIDAFPEANHRQEAELGLPEKKSSN